MSITLSAKQDVRTSFAESKRPFTFAEARELGLDVAALRTKGLTFSETLGYVPKNVSDEKASEATAWSKPSLTDFTDKAWEDLSDTEKRHIAGHFAWSKDNPPESFGDLKLPHHRAQDGAVVWSGVKAAMGALIHLENKLTIAGLFDYYANSLSGGD
jgi:hypothetical protein